MKKPSDKWYRVDRIHLQREFGIHYLTEIFNGVKQCMDRGGVVSATNSNTSSLEKDMQ